MEDPDAISMLLGELKAQGVEAKDQRARIFKILNEIGKVANESLTRSVAVEDQLAGEVMPAIRKLEGLRSKGLLLIAAVGTTGGVVGGFTERLTNAVKVFFAT